MKFFKKHYYIYSMLDELNEAEREYESYINLKLSKMSPGMRCLAKECYFHDGRINLVSNSDDTNTLSVHFLLGDLRRGYRRYELSYSGILEVDAIYEPLEIAVCDRRTEIQVDELIELGDGLWSHNFVFEPKKIEASIIFRDVELKSREATPEEYAHNYAQPPFDVNFEDDDDEPDLN